MRTYFYINCTWPAVIILTYTYRACAYIKIIYFFAHDGYIIRYRRSYLKCIQYKRIKICLTNKKNIYIKKINKFDTIMLNNNKTRIIWTVVHNNNN